jgi:hypothetical protein
MPPSGAPVALNPGLMFRGSMASCRIGPDSQCPVPIGQSSSPLFVLGPMAVQPRLRPEAAG